MKTKEKSNQPPREKHTTKSAGTGKGSLVEKNPMADSKERTPQTNNLGKYGEVQQENMLNKEDNEDSGEDEPVKDNIFLNQQQNDKDKKKAEEKPSPQIPDSEEMNESDEENFEEEGYKKESKD